MQNDLIDDINHYIAYLNERGLSVTVHGQIIGGLLKNNLHRNPFCTLVKTDEEAWQKCIHCQAKIYKKYKSGFIFGMCHAGVEEYVFFVNERIFVSVSGYGINTKKATERINRLSREFYLEKSELLRVYESSLKHEPEDLQQLTALIKPLCHMLYLLQLQFADMPESATKGKIFDAILSYVQRNFMQDLKICDIAQACSCSESTVSHLFKRYTGMSVKKYITDLRISQAKKLLVTSELSVGTIAQMCGFSNINYFPTAFKKYTGVNPTKFRTQA